MLQVAESPRVDDWTLRSALVRFAQAQPELASAILESVRRTQAALDPFVRALLRHGVTVDRRLAVDPGGGLAPMADPVADVRIADLARLVRDQRNGDRVVEAYESAVESSGSEPLDAAEREALPLVVVLVDLDELAGILAGWASSMAPAEPPVADADRLGRLAFERLGALGVARETRERPPGRRPPARSRA